MLTRFTVPFTFLYVVFLVAAHAFFQENIFIAIGYVILAALLIRQMPSSSMGLFASITTIILAQSIYVSGEYKSYFLVANGILLPTILYIRHQSLKLKDRHFQSSKAQLDALWATVVDGLIVIDNRGIIVSSNPATEAIFGYSEEELIGLNVKVLMPKRYAVEHDGYVDAYNRTGKARIIGIGRDVAGTRKDGTEFPLYLAVNRFEVEGETYYGGIVRDMSEEAEIKSALVAAKEAAEEASRTKTKFLSSISHEIRTPLNAIMGFTQLIEMETTGSLVKRQEQHLKYITQSADHLLSLFNEILDLSQIESGQFKLSIESVSAQSALEECLAMIAPLARKHGIIINAIGSVPGETAVLADRVRLKQALANLLTNAIKYNKEGGSVTAEIQMVEEGLLRFMVSDTGVGIPENNQQQLFEPFNRLGREASTIEGAGIGLAVTKTVVEAMNGKVGFSSQLSIGSRFWLDLPLAIPKFEMTKVLQYEGESGPLHRSNIDGVDVPTILYIEDNPANIILLESFLGNHSWLNLKTVSTAEEGLEIARSQKIDLILMDLNLPGMDGFQAQSELAQSEFTRNIPVIAVSADVNFKTVQRAMSVGFKQYIKKPFDLKEAHQTILSTLPPQTADLH